MTDQKLITLAKEKGFHTALIAVKDIPVDEKFRKFCEDNLCGNYNHSYSCPPGCGTPQEVYQHLLTGEKALVLEAIYEIGGYENKAALLESQNKLNMAILELTQKLRQAEILCFGLGYGGCPLCDPCKQALGEPCSFPDRKISCMSAYCIDVGELAKRCGLEFAWDPGKLHLFGMIVF